MTNQKTLCVIYNGDVHLYQANTDEQLVLACQHVLRWLKREGLVDEKNFIFTDENKVPATKEEIDAEFDKLKQGSFITKRDVTNMRIMAHARNEQLIRGLIELQEKRQFFAAVNEEVNGKTVWIEEVWSNPKPTSCRLPKLLTERRPRALELLAWAGADCDDLRISVVDSVDPRDLTRDLTQKTLS